MLRSEEDFLAVSVAKTLSFQCWGTGFDSWSGTRTHAGPTKDDLVWLSKLISKY